MASPAMAIQYQKIANFIRNSRRILFITGAGLSADSGMPTYRGVGGLYNGKSTDDGMPIEDALSGDTLYSNPALTWKYLRQIESACYGVKPSLGHNFMAWIEREYIPKKTKETNGVWVLTQNVDGLHHAAGSQNIIDIHGDFKRLLCMQRGCKETITIEDTSKPPPPNQPLVPPCPCGKSIMRPDVVLFGEMLPIKKLNTLQYELETGFDLVFSVGTTSVFPYIAAPVYQAAQEGVPTVEINPSETQISDVVSIKLSMTAAEAFKYIWELLKKDQ